jgi:ABC-type glycerol-3-phosphate transport system permease component
LQNYDTAIGRALMWECDMRLALRRTLAVAVGSASVMGLVAASPAFAASSQPFPVPSHLVAAAVVAAFMLPAALAGMTPVAKRVRRSRFGLLGVALLIISAVAAPLITIPGF